VDHSWEEQDLDHWDIPWGLETLNDLGSFVLERGRDLDLQPRRMVNLLTLLIQAIDRMSSMVAP